MSVDYAANVMSTQVWGKGEVSRFELATGEKFLGPSLLLGQMVHYKLNDPSERHKFGATSAPGLFAGWRFDAGYTWRGVVIVLDYESVRTRALGYSVPKAVPIEEVYVPKDQPLPLKAAADASLREFSEISLERAFQP